MMAEIKSITYNGKLVDASKNQMIFRWYYDKQNNLKTLYQYAKQKSGYNISFIFDGRNTKITGKDILIRILKIEKGLKILKIIKKNSIIRYDKKNKRTKNKRTKNK